MPGLNGRLAEFERRLPAARAKVPPIVAEFLAGLTTAQLRRLEVLVEAWPGRVIDLEAAAAIIGADEDAVPRFTRAELEAMSRRASAPRPIERWSGGETP
jgi:hypothetical protein